MVSPERFGLKCWSLDFCLLYSQELKCDLLCKEKQNTLSERERMKEEWFHLNYFQFTSFLYSQQQLLRLLLK